VTSDRRTALLIGIQDLGGAAGLDPVFGGF
jgi:hypothetical protein